MNDRELSSELRELERDLAALPRPEPPSELRAAVFRDMRVQLRKRRSRRWLPYLVTAAAVAAVWANVSLETRGSNPFAMAAVDGQIIYEDGSVIQGGRIELEFCPLRGPIGNKYPRAGRVGVDMSDGSFVEVTTAPGCVDDGLVVGEHTVTAVLKDESGAAVDLPVVEPRIVVPSTSRENQLVVKVKKGVLPCEPRRK